jgi:hypothetical protein
MKTKISLLLVLMSLIMATGYSQEKTKKEIKAEKKLELQKQVEAMVNAKEFVFVARTALPSGMRSVNLATNPNYVKYHPELIESEMPFFGRAYSGVGYGSDTGLRFKGKPAEYTIVKNKKNFQIDATVEGTSDRFRLSLLVGFEGGSSLSITSNSRSTISYQGEISAPEKEEKK